MDKHILYISRFPDGNQSWALNSNLFGNREVVVFCPSNFEKAIQTLYFSFENRIKIDKTSNIVNKYIEETVLLETLRRMAFAKIPSSVSFKTVEKIACNYCENEQEFCFSEDSWQNPLGGVLPKKLVKRWLTVKNLIVLDFGKLVDNNLLRENRYEKLVKFSREKDLKVNFLLVSKDSNKSSKDKILWNT